MKPKYKNDRNEWTYYQLSKWNFKDYELYGYAIPINCFEDDDEDIRAILDMKMCGLCIYANFYKTSTINEDESINIGNQLLVYPDGSFETTFSCQSENRRYAFNAKKYAYVKTMYASIKNNKQFTSFEDFLPKGHPNNVKLPVLATIQAHTL